MENTLYLELSQLQLFASSICNLDCSFCYLQNQHKNNAYALLNKEIQDAWISGNYVNNIKKVFHKLHSDPNLITTLSFWGGEPLILTKNLIKPLEELLDYFKNVESIFISTNFTKIDDLAEFIQIIENSNNKKKTLTIQLSIDSPFKELQQLGHNVEWSRYYQNITNLFSNISRIISLKYTTIQFTPHGTLNWPDYFKYLNSIDQLDEFYHSFKNLFNYIHIEADKYGLSDNIITMDKYLWAHIAEPYTFSVEQSLQLNNQIKLMNYYRQKNNIPYDQLNNNLTYSAGNSYLFENNPSCGTSGTYGASLLPDGTICGCFGDFILNTKEFWDWANNPLYRKFYRKSLIQKRLYFNPLTATDQEIADYLWYIYSMFDNSSTKFHISINLAIEMAKSGQVDYINYQNYFKLFNNLSQFSHDMKCIKDQITMTGSIYTVPIGNLRKYLNGAADIGQNTYLEEERWKISCDLKTAHM